MIWGMKFEVHKQRREGAGKAHAHNGYLKEDELQIADTFLMKEQDSQDSMSQLLNQFMARAIHEFRFLYT